MTIIKKIKAKLKQSRSISNQFALLMSVLILTTIIFLSGYNIYITDKLVGLSNFEKERITQSISNLLVDATKNTQNDTNFKYLDMMTKNLISDRVILYASVVDLNTSKCIWSTIEGAAGLENSTEKDMLKLFQGQNSYILHINNFSKNTDKYQVIIGYNSKSDMASYVNILLENNNILALMFIFLGILSAFVMSRIVTHPINKLCKATKEFARGNMQYRIDYSNYYEINNLIDSYNQMAEKLDRMYSSLEQQVQDRTKEIVLKNEQIEKAYEELKEAQTMMVHNEKMRSLGEMVAGITHEINNPVNFVYGNLIHLNEYSNNLIKIIQEYEKIEDKLSDDEKKAISKIKEELEFSFIKEDLPELLRSCKDGTERTKDIILDLKSFSKLDDMKIKEVDIHREINLCLNILRNKYKNKITVHKDFGNLPFVESYGGQLNQVLMNILDNAAYAIKDQGDVYIKTFINGNDIKIEIEDNGYGMDDTAKKKVFEPFYTTKPIGEGTGLGMSISYKIIKNHNGIIEVESEKGQGTKFTIKMPATGLKEFEKQGI
ncbi:MAG: ATP-binding protein [Candidatus Gastranaerophilales bacterium]|nr:ATP-binding protein [Candidatus Gastranaerophilales bacterium]